MRCDEPGFKTCENSNLQGQKSDFNFGGENYINLFLRGNTNSSAIILLRDPANSGKHRPALLLQTLIVIFTVMHLGGKS